MRQITHQLILLAFIVSLFLIGSPTEMVTEAATTTVNSEAELVAAINAANTNPGPDTIVLESDISLATTTPFIANGPSGLPTITSEIIIKGDGHRIVRTSAVEFRIVEVSATGSLWLDQVTLARGQITTGVGTIGGAIHNLGALTITQSTIGGSPADANSAVDGGAIWTRGRTSIIDTTISNNEALDNGGAIFAYRIPNLQLVRSQVIQNNATVYGGGIYCECFTAATIDIRDSQINNNAVTGTTFTRGGGIYVSTSVDSVQMSVLNSDISGNTVSTSATEARAGGIYFNGTSSNGNVSSSLTIMDSSVNNNIGVADGHIFSAGFYGAFVNTTISDSIFDGNVAQSTATSASSVVWGGAMLLWQNTSVLITNTTISNNRTEVNYTGGSAWCCGAGIWSGANLTIVNTTVSSNISRNTQSAAGMRGGGMVLTGPTTIINSTIINNEASPTGIGGGIAKSASDPITLANNIIGNNVAVTGPDCGIFFFPQTDYISEGYNLFSNTAGCPGMPGTDDLVGAVAMGPLANNGGPTLTHLPLASPPINSGNPATDPTPPGSGIACPATDQRGAPRNVDRCDIGAVEASATPPAVYNFAPIGVDDGIYSTPFETPITVPVATGLLANDTDADDATIHAFPASPPTNGFVTINTDGSFTYTPQMGFSGTDTFTYVVCDERGTCDSTPQTATIQVGSIAPIYNSNPAPTTPIAINTTVNVTGSAQILVTNTGTDILQITNIALTGNPEISTTSGPFAIDVGGAAVMIGLECTSATANTFTATLTVSHNDPNSPAIYPITCTVTDDTIDPPDPPDPDPDPPTIVVFDPALSKIGELGPGQLGLTGEQLVWTTTVSNPSGVAGINIVLTDTLRPELQIDNVESDRGTVSVSGQTVTVTIAILNPGETVQIRITTTVLLSPSDGLFSNTIWLNADGNIRRSATATVNVPIGLPDTGYPPAQID